MSGWLWRSRCAAQQSEIDGQGGARIELRVQYLAGRLHLPIVSLERAA